MNLRATIIIIFVIFYLLIIKKRFEKKLKWQITVSKRIIKQLQKEQRKTEALYKITLEMLKRLCFLERSDVTNRYLKEIILKPKTCANSSETGKEDKKWDM